MKEYRTVTAVDMHICEHGHFIKADNPRKALQFKNSCGHWVWDDANFCDQCGSPVDKERP